MLLLACVHVCDANTWKGETGGLNWRQAQATERPSQRIKVKTLSFSDIQDIVKGLRREGKSPTDQSQERLSCRSVEKQQRRL